MILASDKILVVDDEPNNRKLLQQILKDTYDLSFAVNGAQAVKAAKAILPDLILMDIMMPEMDGFQACRILKSDPGTHKIPIIFVTAMNEIQDETKGFDVGGVDYLTKPVSKPVVLARVATHLALFNQQKACERQVVKRTAMYEESQRSAIYMLGEAGHFNDDGTGFHIWRMGAYAAALARAAGWPVARARELELAAAMHDTGKIGIPDAVLKKKGKLLPKEWQIMKTHTIIGHRILSKNRSPFFKLAAEIALGHHEKWDGSGYPNKWVQEQTPEAVRLVAIADVFDALTMRRPYKEAWSVEKSFAEIEKIAGTHLDPDLAEHFLNIQPTILEIRERFTEKALSSESDPDLTAS